MVAKQFYAHLCTMLLQPSYDTATLDIYLLDAYIATKVDTRVAIHLIEALLRAPHDGHKERSLRLRLATQAPLLVGNITRCHTREISISALYIHTTAVLRGYHHDGILAMRNRDM